MIRITRRLIQKILTLVCSLFGIQAAVSCGDDGIFQTVYDAPVMYGMPPNYGYVSGKVFGDTDGDGTVEPLKNVHVYYNEENETNEKIVKYVTDEDGSYHVDLREKGAYVFSFEDGDGAENGSFKLGTKRISWNEGDMLTGQDITLERDVSEDGTESEE